jgi:uncharacterized surface protein with fasciclin (FAS1) repeats
MDRRTIIIGALVLIGIILIIFFLLRNVFRIIGSPFSLVSPTPTPIPSVIEIPTSAETPTYVVTITPMPTLTPTTYLPKTSTTPSINPTLAPSKNLVNTIKGNSNLSLFSKAINDSGLDGVISTTGPYTVFAPNDTAMNTYFNSKGGIPSDLSTLNIILKNHIVYGNIATQDLTSGKKLTTLNNQILSTDGTTANATVLNSKIVDTIKASNGNVYIIDTVLVP